MWRELVICISFANVTEAHQLADYQVVGTEADDHKDNQFPKISTEETTGPTRRAIPCDILQHMNRCEQHKGFDDIVHPFSVFFWKPHIYNEEGLHVSSFFSFRLKARQRKKSLWMRALIHRFSSNLRASSAFITVKKSRLTARQINLV